MSRTLLLCFVHGFKGTEDTFHNFPKDLEIQVAKQLPDHRVQSVVYPKYETTGELAAATEAFLGWLRERVMEIRKAHSEKPWPPTDRDVGVILVAHSMGGFVAADTLFLALNDRDSSTTTTSSSEPQPLFPLIHGILAFDTPYNGLARSMFVYGAFSNYQKVSNVFNAMAALSAAAPATLSRLTTTRRVAAAVSPASRPSSNNPAWKTWQLVAVRTGTVGAIAAGGVAAYQHRAAILRGVQAVRGLSRESVAHSYRQGVDAVGQGLSYVNRGSVGRSFAWLSDHFTFVGTLLRPRELSRRLDRLAALRGVGVRDFYVSLGENGVWSGGYFVPERTFCAVPTAATTAGGDEEEPAARLFSRRVMTDVDDEIMAHIGMFRPDKNKGYDDMTAEAAGLAREWFLSEEPAVDDEKFRRAPVEDAEDAAIKEALEKDDANVLKADEAGGEETVEAVLPDESPIDIAAAASLVPLPEDGDGDDDGAEALPETSAEERKTYMQHLFRVAQEAGTGIRGAWPAKMPAMPAMPAMPSMPGLPSMGKVSMPSVNNLFWRKDRSAEASQTQEMQQPEEVETTTTTTASAAAGQPHGEGNDGDVDMPAAPAAAHQDASEHDGVSAGEAPGEQAGGEGGEESMKAAARV